MAASGSWCTQYSCRFALCSLYVYDQLWMILQKVIHKPAGYFMAPEAEERIGDVSNVVFSNGWIVDQDGTVFIYYALIGHPSSCCYFNH